MEKKSKFVTFILSFFVPGAGHLYLGLQARGLQLMALFFGCIILMPTLPLVFPFLLAMTWFYSMFDALQKATLINLRVDHARADGLGAGISPAGMHVRDANGSIMERDFLAEHPVWVGAGFIALGILIFIGILFPDFWSFIRHIHLGTLLVALALIGFGVWLIRSQRVNSNPGRDTNGGTGSTFASAPIAQDTVPSGAGESGTDPQSFEERG